MNPFSSVDINLQRQLKTEVEPVLIQSIFNKEEVKHLASKISPRIGELYEELSTFYITNQFVPIQRETFFLKIQQIFNIIKYAPSPSESPICRKRVQKNTYYYTCFDCQKMANLAICQNCFNENQHQNHNYRIRKSEEDVYCDCGNQQFFDKQYFCHSHKIFVEPQPLQKKQIQIFKKQIQFLLNLGLALKRSAINMQMVIKQTIFKNIVVLLVQICEGSYNYQRLVSEILLQRVSKNYHFWNSSGVIIEIIFSQIWTNMTLQKLTKLCLVLYPAQKIRHKILEEFLKQLTIKDRHFTELYFLPDINESYLTDGKMILKLMETGTVSPIVLGENFQTQAVRELWNGQLFKFYKDMESPQYPKIISYIFSKVNICSYFERIVIKNSNEKTDHSFCKGYLRFICSAIKKIGKLSSAKSVLSKIINQCFVFLKGKDKNNLNFNGERTLALAIFSYFDYDLKKLQEAPLEDLYQLFCGIREENFLQSLQDFEQQAQKMLGSYLNLGKIPNYFKYKDFINDSQYWLNRKNKIVLSIDYTYCRMLVIILKKIYQQQSCQNFKFLQRLLLRQDAQQQKLIAIFDKQAHKQQLAGEQARKKIHEVMECNLFVRIEEHVNVNMWEIVSALQSILFFSESNMPEIVLANSMGHSCEEQISLFLRELGTIYKDKSKLQFKQTAEKYISNEQIIKKFIVNEFQKYSKQEIKSKYITNLSFSSLYMESRVICDQVEQRFFMKKSEQPAPQLSHYIFSRRSNDKIVKLFKDYIQFLLSPSLQIGKDSLTSASMNEAVYVIFYLFLQTKQKKYEEIFTEILLTNRKLLDHFDDYSKYIVRMWTLSVVGTAHKDVQADKKDQAKKLKQKKMQQIKQRQQNILDNFKKQDNAEQILSEQNDVCIICKTTNNSDLNYLSFARYSNILSMHIFNTTEPFLLITTCGHKIHQKCMEQNISDNNNYKINYECFLCKQISNLRVPVIVFSENNQQKIERFVQYLLTVISLVDEQKKADANTETSKFNKQQFSSKFYTSVVYKIFLYFFSYPDFYITRMKPILPIEVIILRYLARAYQVSLKMNEKPIREAKLLAMVQSHITELIFHQDVKQIQLQLKDKLQTSQKDQNDEDQTDSLKEMRKLSLFVIGCKNIQLRPLKHLQRLKFYSLPKDLCDLNRQMGVCSTCTKITSKIMICFYCGVKICKNCTKEINNHMSAMHMSAGITISSETGQFVYHLKGNSAAFPSLYQNYVGEPYRNDCLPEKNKYLLSRERNEKMLNEVLNDRVQSIVEECVRDAINTQLIRYHLGQQLQAQGQGQEQECQIQ